jgi:prevent-host-death family protein
VTRAISVAEAKRRFSEILARTAYAGERFLIARRGKPLAALVALEDLRRLEEQGRTGPQGPQGLVGGARALADYRDWENVMASVYRARRRSRGRSVRLR